MSACDTCRMPGRCCSGFQLGLLEDRAPTMLDAFVFLATMVNYRYEGRSVGGPGYDVPEGAENVQIGLPFLPLMLQGGWWMFTCPLLVDGRCSDYDNRPELCRDYQPMSDLLCAEHPDHAL